MNKHKTIGIDLAKSSFHSSFIESGSTGQPFLIHIQVERNVCHDNKVEGEGKFNSYGLATIHKHQGTFPFRNIAKF